MREGRISQKSGQAYVRRSYDLPILFHKPPKDSLKNIKKREVSQKMGYIK
jgi:hypothetical protein